MKKFFPLATNTYGCMAECLCGSVQPHGENCEEGSIFRIPTPSWPFRMLLRARGCLT